MMVIQLVHCIAEQIVVPRATDFGGNWDGDTACAYRRGADCGFLRSRLLFTGVTTSHLCCDWWNWSGLPGEGPDRD